MSSKSASHLLQSTGHMFKLTQDNNVQVFPRK